MESLIKVVTIIVSFFINGIVVLLNEKKINPFLLLIKFATAVEENSNRKFSTINFVTVHIWVRDIYIF